MSSYSPTVSWHSKQGEDFSALEYHRDHEWTFPGGEVVLASASPEFGGNGNRVNPDEAVIAATSSCHMLTFLAIAAKQKQRVLSYIDQPEGIVEKNDEGRVAITRITLRPRVVFETEVSAEKVQRLHDAAHRNCFVANSLRTPVSIELQ